MKLAVVTMETMMELDLPFNMGEWNAVRQVVLIDQRKLARALRRVRRRMGNTLARRCRTQWWIMFWRICRHHGVRA